MRDKPSQRGSWVRLTLMALVVGSTILASAAFASMTRRQGAGALDLFLIACFALLFFWVASAFWTSTLGFARLLAHPEERPSLPSEPHGDGDACQPLPRTAILIPIHNEDAWQVAANAQTMREAIRKAGHEGDFDLFILSDTTDPDLWAEEEWAWAWLRGSAGGAPNVYYRRRRENIGHKSGNIADFCEHWGGGYTYMVVLDADSILDARTLLEMVRRMEAGPQIGILQVPSHLVNRGSLFARAQQFASSVYGEILMTGYALWAGSEGNYWGHNAIIRVKPFADHCRLPSLPGQPPLGGEILSHDFVEAALMRRAGWEVVIAHDLGGSYEECPTTLQAFARRDQRWCQGNLQHLRLIATQGFHPVSRAHLGIGAMSYLCSPLWFMFMILAALGAAIVVSQGRGPQAPLPRPIYTASLLFVVSMAFLLLPKVWGYVLLLRNPRRLAAHGGAVKAAASVVLEALLGTLLAPIMMGFHTFFVGSTLAGRRVRWEAQPRGETTTPLRLAARTYGWHSVAGAAGAVLIAWLVPNIFWWVLPVLAGLAFSIPLSIVLSSAPAGLMLRSYGLLVTEEETAAPQVLARQRQWSKAILAARDDLPPDRAFYQVILDPAVHGLHVALLQATGPAAPDAPNVERLRQIALYGGPKRLTRRERLDLLSSEAAMRQLHHDAWCQWPLKTLGATVSVAELSTQIARRIRGHAA